MGDVARVLRSGVSRLRQLRGRRPHRDGARHCETDEEGPWIPGGAVQARAPSTGRALQRRPHTAPSASVSTAPCASRGCTASTTGLRPPPASSYVLAPATRHASQEAAGRRRTSSRHAQAHAGRALSSASNTRRVLAGRVSLRVFRGRSCVQTGETPAPHAVLRRLVV